MNSELYNNILAHINTDTVGVIWFSESTLSEPTEVNEIFDYIVDGQLREFVEFTKENNIETEKENNFFISHNFDSPFILFNTCISHEFSKKDFNDFKMILSKLGNHSQKNLAVIYPKSFKLPEVVKKSDLTIREFSY
ncbi:MAG: hypothetical protein BM556_07675 [Bacteriovorax sp. MedPE-SWde]|nr:MAG: hypothetical protein BM556_07675 [Bacteriovorax sp. MedPE-SWde]